MKCCGSPTTSIVPERTPSRARDVAAAFDAILFKEAFAPLARAIGFYGDAAVDATARILARRERGGLTDALEGAIEANARQSPSAAP